MTVVYVLTSCDKDLYFEQFLISAISLKLHNPNIPIVLLCDSDTAKSKLAVDIVDTTSKANTTNIDDTSGTKGVSNIANTTSTNDVTSATDIANADDANNASGASNASNASNTSGTGNATDVSGTGGTAGMGGAGDKAYGGCLARLVPFSPRQRLTLNGDELLRKKSAQEEGEKVFHGKVLIKNFLYNCKRKVYKAFFVEVIAVEFEKGVPSVYRSRLLKTQIPKFITAPFLYIDCDTVICDKLDAIEKELGLAATGGVLDGHCLIEEHLHRDYFLRRDKALGFGGTKALGYNINGGILYCSVDESAKKLFDAWEEAWIYSAYKKHDAHDQSALNEAINRTHLKVALLNGQWNCQVAHGGLQFLGGAKIIHYYSSELGGRSYTPYYKLANSAFLEKFKAFNDFFCRERARLSASDAEKLEGELESFASEVDDLTQNAKFAFDYCHIISDKRIVSVMQSPLLFTLADLKARCPPLYKALEALAGGFRAFGKKVVGIVRRKKG